MELVGMQEYKMDGKPNGNQNHGFSDAYEYPDGNEVQLEKVTVVPENSVKDPDGELHDGKDERKIEYENIEDGAEVDDDDDEPPNCFTRHVLTVQTAVRGFLKTHKRHIKWIILILAIMGYIAYFGYAMWYKFGDEGSIRLLWVTCLVVFCLAIHYIWKYFGDKIDTVMEPCSTFVDAHSRAINYAILCALAILIIVFTLVDIFYTTKSPYNLVSASGIAVYVLLFFIFSYNPSKVKWRTVAWGFVLQFVMALFILRWSFGYEVFQWLGDRVQEYLVYVNTGSAFVFGAKYTDVLFAFQVLPTVIFFSATISVLYYLGVMQYIIVRGARVMQACMGTTACESINAAGCIFVGQSEAPLMIGPVLPFMTRSELHAVLTGGFANIAGSVLGAYISFGVPANHLLAASVMSAPAALAISKLMYPETEKSKTDAKGVSCLFQASGERNLMEALAAGASNAIGLVANIAANLIVFLATLEFVNATLTYFGQRVGIEKLTLQFICSYVLWPFALVMGVHIDDCRTVASLMGIKTFLNEFIAYQELGVIIENKKLLDAHVALNMTYHYQGDNIILDFPSGNSTVTLLNGVLSERSVVIATYALCGFSNIGSIGIQLGTLGSIAPTRKADFARLVVRAMIAGSVACFTTACIAGLYFQQY